MESKRKIFINPFAIPSTLKNAKKPESNSNVHQSAKQSLAAFANFNPTLTHAIPPPPIHHYNHTNTNQKRPFTALNNNSYNDYNAPQIKRRKRQKYRNDGGLTDEQYQRLLEARANETEKDIANYIAKRKRNYPSKTNVSKKRQIINAKTKRGQLLSINEKIMKFKDDTGNRKTPSVLRFLKTPKFNQNIVRKVLHKEIEQEYSAILQCFRHIIKTNYFTQDISEYSNDNGNVSECVSELNGKTNSNVLMGDFSVEDVKKEELLMNEEVNDNDLNIELDSLSSILAPQSK